MLPSATGIPSNPARSRAFGGLISRAYRSHRFRCRAPLGSSRIAIPPYQFFPFPLAGARGRVGRRRRGFGHAPRLRLLAVLAPHPARSAVAFLSATSSGRDCEANFAGTRVSSSRRNHLLIVPRHHSAHSKETVRALPSGNRESPDSPRLETGLSTGPARQEESPCKCGVGTPAGVRNLPGANARTLWTGPPSPATNRPRTGREGAPPITTQPQSVNPPPQKSTDNPHKIPPPFFM